MVEANCPDNEPSGLDETGKLGSQFFNIFWTKFLGVTLRTFAFRNSIIQI